MNWMDAFILGLVEGITEYLPVSSTGHLILASSFLGLTGDDVKTSVDAFSIIVQGGAILAVLGLYRKRVGQMIRGVFGRDAAGRKLFVNLVIAFIPAAILGVLLNDLIEEWLFRPIPVLAALALGGVWMIWLGRRGEKPEIQGESNDESNTADAPSEQLTIETMTWRTALLIGFFQVVAMWPGTSRSMMTIAGGTLLGLRTKEAAEFSFLLGLPTLGGATVYRLAKDLKKAHDTGDPNMFQTLGVTPVIIGIVVATVAAALAVRWLVAFLNKHGLAAFGWYRIALTAALGAMLLTNIISFG